MGSSASRPSPLAPTFERMASWDMKAAKKLLADYKEKDLDFGLDAQALAALCGGDNAHAEAAIDAFGGTNGIVNALAYICGAILVSRGAALEKAGLVFDALDFDMTEQITMDEMTIVLLCCARGFCVLSATGTVPSDEALESVTLQAYRELSKSGGHGITKTEFTKWVLKYMASSPTALLHTEVSLDDMAVQFGLVAAPLPAKSLADQVLSELAAETNNTGEYDGDESIYQQEETVAFVEAESLPMEEAKGVEASAFSSPQDQDEEEKVRETEATIAVEELVDASQSRPDPHVEEATPEAEAVISANAVYKPVDASGGQEAEYTEEFQAETPRVDAQEGEEEEPMQRPASAPTDAAALPVEGEGTLEGDVLVHEDVMPQESEEKSAAPASREVKPDGEAAADAAEGEPASDGVWDLNAYDTYDFTDTAYDVSSGLPPPDPHEDAPDEPMPGQEAAAEERTEPVETAPEATVD